MHEQSKRLTILTAKEMQAIYGLPQFTDEERLAYFTLDSREQSALKRIRTLTANVYFILQLGFFKAKRQFFVFDLRSVADDVAYILRKYYPDTASLSDTTISKPTRLAQQDEILRFMDYQLCSKAWKQKLEEKANGLVVVYTKPLYILGYYPDL